MSSNNTGVQVVVRLRPLNEREKKHGTLPVVSASTNDKTVTVIKGTGSRQARTVYAFDDVFTAFSTQEEVFETTLKPVIKDVLTGYSSCVCAYGQTGTGKTHTMEGSLDHHDDYGVIPRSVEAIFERLNREDLHYESYNVYCSFLEIYNEELCDLLADNNHNNNHDILYHNNSSSAGSGGGSPGRKGTNSSHNGLAVMEGKNGPFCRGLSEVQVQNASDLLELMKRAQNSRKVGETNMNKQSSRSHCIFTLKVHAKRRLEDGALFESKGKLHMVDLAGSECAKTANLSDGNGSEQVARDRERMNINRSLLTLGRVVKMLKEQSLKGDKAGNVRIPYRDSKLTRILQNALGGNSKTVIVATLSPSVTAIEESISTLNYAQAAHGIINKPVSASYMSQSTNASSLLSGKDAPGSGQVGSIEKWTELETRLEYMQSQVEEAKAALARKHLQQQELVDRAEKAEADKIELEKKTEELIMKNVSLQEELGDTKDKLCTTENELKETKGQLEKTTIVLHATQKTESSLTKEALALINALKESVADGDKLHQLVLENRRSDMERRKAAKKFNGSIASLLTEVKETLVVLAKQEKKYQTTTIELATSSTNKELEFIEKAKGVLQIAIAEVEKAVTALNSSIHDADGIVPTANALVSGTQSQVNGAWSMVEKSEEELISQFVSSREQIANFGVQLQQLETMHDDSLSNALSELESNVVASKQKTESLVSSTITAMEKARDDRKKIRNATKETIEQWKLSMITGGDSILKQLTDQKGSVEQTMTMMNSEMQRHASIKSQLKNQSLLLQNSHQESIVMHDAQKQLLLDTKTKSEQSHNQQTQLLSSFASNLMKEVESLVKNQMSRVMQEVDQSHSRFMQNNQSLVENHSNIAASTLETIREAKSLASTIQEEAKAAEENDKVVISHLGETNTVFSNLQSIVKEQNASVESLAAQTDRHLNHLEELEIGDTALCEQLKGNGKDCVNFLSNAFAKDTRQHISTLGEAGKSLATFSRSQVLESIASSVDDMERPRSAVMAAFANDRLNIEKAMSNGLTTIREKASESSCRADELHRAVQSVATEFTENTIVERRSEVDETKQLFVEEARQHVDFASESIRQSQEKSQKVNSEMDHFVMEDLSAYEELPNAIDRVKILFSDQLSSTPSEKEILAAIGKLGKGDMSTASVLQALSPNHDKIASSNHKKSRRHVVQNPPHERHEPRSERIVS